MIKGGVKVVEFTIVDNESEECLKKFVDLQELQKAKRVYHNVRKQYSDREHFNRLVDNLYERKLLCKKPQTYKDPYTKATCHDNYYDITQLGKNYFVDKEEYIREQNEREKLTQSSQPPIHIKNSGNLFYNVANSSISIVSSIQIENEIEAKGGEDKQILLALLREVEEMAAQIKANQLIPQNKGFIDRVSVHLQKHKWLYEPIIALLGQAVYKAFGG